MDASTSIALVSAVIAIASVCIACWAVVKAEKLQRMQWKRDELALRRDVLRRLLAYRYRLTKEFLGQDGEPFIALNEAWIVFAGFSEVTAALTTMHDEIGQEGLLIPNIVALVRTMAAASDISVHDLDDAFIENPFSPPSVL